MTNRFEKIGRTLDLGDRIKVVLRKSEYVGHVWFCPKEDVIIINTHDGIKEPVIAREKFLYTYRGNILGSLDAEIYLGGLHPLGKLADNTNARYNFIERQQLVALELKNKKLITENITNIVVMQKFYQGWLK